MNQQCVSGGAEVAGRGLLYQHMDRGQECRHPGPPPARQGHGPVRPVHALRRAISRGTAPIGLGARGRFTEGRARAALRRKFPGSGL